MFPNLEIWPTESVKLYDCEGCGARFRVRVPWMARVPAGHQAWAQASASGQAIRAFEQVAHERRCPVCATSPVELSRDRRLIVGWVVALVILAIPAFLLYTVLAGGHMPSLSDTWAIGIGVTLVFASIVALQFVSRRHLRPRAAKATGYALELVDEGFARPGTADGRLAPVRRPYWATCLLCLGAVALLVPEMTRLLQGWSGNPDVFPAVCGPGDVVRISLPNGPLSMEGEWRGEAQLVVAATADKQWHPDEFELTMPDEHWDGRLDQQRSRVRPWVDVKLPSDESLKNSALELWIVAKLVYPEMDHAQELYNDVSTSVERKCVLQLSEPRAGSSYEWVRNISWACASLAALAGAAGWLVHFLRTPIAIKNIDVSFVEVITATT